jgi:hypothetical protein
MLMLAGIASRPGGWQCHLRPDHHLIANSQKKRA